MHEAALARAACQAPTVILGLLLRPFSLGHFLHLIRHGIVEESEGPFNPLRLPQAVWISAQSWSENQRTPSDRWLGIKFAIWNWRTRKSDLVAESRRFIRYMESGSEGLPVSEIVSADAATPRPTGAPFLLRLQQWLMQEMRLSEAEAWDYPLGLAKMRWATFWESQDCLRIYNEHEQSFDRYVAEQEAKAAAGRN